MPRPLAERRFLITRPQNQSATLARLLREAGAVPLLAPMIDIGSSSDPDALAGALQRLEEFDLVVFVSPTALDEVAARVNPWPAELPVAVVGPASRDRALALGMAEVICPDSQFDSEGLLAHPALQQMAGRRVLLLRGNGGREVLSDTLRARGATVEAVEAYRRLPPRMPAGELAALLAQGCDGVVMTSSEAVSNLFALADPLLAERLRTARFFASHPAIAEAAQRHGVGQVELVGTGDEAIVAALSRYFEAGASAVAAPPLRSPAPAPASHRISRPQRAWLGFVRRTAVLAVITVAVSALVYQFQARALHGELKARLQQLEGSQLALQASAQRDALQRQQLELALAGSQNSLETVRAQQADLMALYGAVAGDHEEALLADAELTLSLASQQLQLTGNVSAAQAALYRLDERLAGHDKPRLLGLRRAVVRDLEQLKAMPWIDYIGLSARLDGLAGLVDKLPLVVDGKPAPAGEAADEARHGLLGELGRALGALVEIRRVDQPTPVLLAPEQAFYLREHLRLRLLSARLALLQRDESTFRYDLSAAQVTVREHFDTRSKPVRAFLEALAQTQTARPAQAVPTLADSLNAARDARRKSSREDSK